MARQIKGMRAFSTSERRAIRAALIAKYGYFCQICLQNGKTKEAAAIITHSVYEDNSFSVDHILALADGGQNTLENMWPTHIACNERKGSVSGGGRVRSNRRPRSERENVTHVTGVRLAYSSTTP